MNVGMFGGTSVADQGGFALNVDQRARGIDRTPASRRTPSSREASTKIIEDTLNWLKGTHSLSFGGVVDAG